MIRPADARVGIRLLRRLPEGPSPSRTSNADPRPGPRGGELPRRSPTGSRGPRTRQRPARYVGLEAIRKPECAMVGIAGPSSLNPASQSQVPHSEAL